MPRAARKIRVPRGTAAFAAVIVCALFGVHNTLLGQTDVVPADTLPPVWNGPPAYIGGCDREDGSRYAYLALPIDAEDVVAVEVRIQKGRNESDTLLLVPRRDIVEEFSGAILVSDEVILQLDPAPTGQRVSVPDHAILPVGNGEYGGGIKFEPGETYRIAMTLIDAAGNRSVESKSGTITIPDGSADARSAAPTTGGSATVADDSESSSGIRIESDSQRASLIPVFERDSLH